MKKYAFFAEKTIEKDKRIIAGREVKYKLYALHRPCGFIYAIEVCDPGGRASRRFGKDKNAALEIYKRIVACTVTSCTLDDIADDFTAEGNLIG